MPSWKALERTEDWATVGPCWVRSGMAQVRSVLRCQPWSASGGKCMLPTCRVSPGLPTDVLSVTEFVIVCGCVARDVHNAFRWSLFFQFRDLGLLRNAHVAVEFLRNSVSSMYQYLGQWIPLRLKLKDPDAKG